MKYFELKEQADRLFDTAKVIVKKGCSVKNFLEIIGPSYIRIMANDEQIDDFWFDGDLSKINTDILGKKVLDCNLSIDTEEYGARSPWEDNWELTIETNTIKKKKKSLFW